MGQQEDQMKSLKRESPERIPISVSILPSAWMKHRERLEAIADRHPLLFEKPGERRDYDRISDPKYVQGDYVDPWGCVWRNIKVGMNSLVTVHPVPTREAVRSLKMPETDDGLPHGCMYLRLGDLRGFEEIMIDFAEEPPELKMLLDLVLEYNLRQVRKHLASLHGQTGQFVGFGDDLGMQHSLPISPEKWRKYLKPCFSRMFRPFRDAGHYVYLHTDGHILEIIPDLIDCGVDVLNPQVGANGLANLAVVCKGKVCVNLDLNRQMFPFWTPRDIDEHVREAVEKLGMPEGGLWLHAEIADDVPLANVEAICSAMERHSLHFS